MQPTQGDINAPHGTMVQIQHTGSFMVALDLKLLLKSRCDAHRGRVSSAIGRTYVRIIRRLLVVVFCSGNHYSTYKASTCGIFVSFVSHYKTTSCRILYLLLRSPYRRTYLLSVTTKPLAAVSCIFRESVSHYYKTTYCRIFNVSFDPYLCFRVRIFVNHGTNGQCIESLLQ